jgi:hypothetical protein
MDAADKGSPMTASAPGGKPLLRPFANQRFDLMATLEERRDQLTPHESSAASDKHEVFFLNHGVETPMSLCS